MLKTHITRTSTTLAALAAMVPLAGACAKPQSRLLAAVPPPAPHTVQVFSPGNAHYTRGMELKKKGSIDQALIEFLQASKENPRLTHAFYEQALIFRQKGYNKLAESALTQALQINPDFTQATLLMAALRLENGNVNGAANTLGKTLGLTPVTTRPTVTPAVKVSKKETPAENTSSDPWADRLLYLSKHGTASLKPGQAFMYSEETGEAVLFLEDGKKIRRVIASRRDNGELVKERRPELLLPRDLVYKLSAEGRISELAADEKQSQDEERAESKKDRDDFFERDIADNPWTRKPEIPDEMKTSSEPLESLNTVAPQLKTAAGEAARSGLAEPENFGSDDRSFARVGSLSEQFGMDALVEKTQKFFGWCKKALHLP